MAEIERRTRSYGLPPVRWPDPWPTNYLFAMRAATYAFTVGRGQEFVLQAFRDAFQRGAELSDVSNVLRAAEAAGLAPELVAAGAEDPQVKAQLHAATDAAHELCLIGVPTIAIDDELFWGDDRLEDAAAHLAIVSMS
jgi:2-hydroxychromene-2-carboxylate isomerase